MGSWQIYRQAATAVYSCTDRENSSQLMKTGGGGYVSGYFFFGTGLQYSTLLVPCFCEVNLFQYLRKVLHSFNSTTTKFAVTIVSL